MKLRVYVLPTLELWEEIGKANSSCYELQKESSQARRVLEETTQNAR